MADQIFTATNWKVSQSALMLNEAETRNPCLVRVVRNSFFLLTCAYCISPLGWRDFLSNQYRDLQTPILDSAGNPVEVDLDWLDFNEADNENFCPFTACESTIEKAVRTHDDNLRSYFSETCCEPVRRNVRPVIHKRKRQRFIAMASIIGAAFPGISMHWPRHPVAMNDNDPMATRMDGCR